METLLNEVGHEQKKEAEKLMSTNNVKKRCKELSEILTTDRDKVVYGSALTAIQTDVPRTTADLMKQFEAAKKRAAEPSTSRKRTADIDPLALVTEMAEFSRRPRVSQSETPIPPATPNTNARAEDDFGTGNISVVCTYCFK